MAEIGRNSFVVDTQDQASAKFDAIKAKQAGMVNSAVAGNTVLAASTQKLATVQNSARMATFSLTQAIQDAPYGFRGVANNIEFLTQNLVTLSAQTGGAAGAMKAIGATLSGPVGILFAVSAVSAAIQFLAPKFGMLGTKAEEATPKIKGLADVLALFSKNIAGAETNQLDTLFEKAKSDLEKMKAELAAIKPTVERVTVGRSGLIARENVLTTQQVELQKSLNAQIQRQEELVKTLTDALPGDTQRIKERTKAQEDDAKRQSDWQARLLREALKTADEMQKQIGRLFIMDPATDKLVEINLEESQKRYSKWLADLREQATEPLPVPKVGPRPQLELGPDPVVDLINSVEQLGATWQNVNGLIISSVQGAASAITDAFFGATKSIADFFSDMIKAVVRMITEQLLKYGILKLIGSFIPGAGVVATVFGGLAKAAPTKAPAENIGQTAVRNLASENVKNTTNIRNVVSETVKNIQTSRDVRTLPAISSERKADKPSGNTFVFNLPGGQKKNPSVADLKYAVRLLNEAIANERAY